MLRSRDVPATSALRSWAWNSATRASPDKRTIYSKSVHEDGTSGIWAVGDRGRGEPRLVVALDRPDLGHHVVSVAGDRIYLTARRKESDVWVATVR